MNEELQKKAVEFEMLQGNLRMIQEKGNLIARKLEELTVTKAAIEELAKTKAGKAFIPIGTGNFVEGTISETDKILIGVGSEVAIKMPKDKAIKLADERLEELNKNILELSNHEKLTINQMRKVQEEVEKLQK